MKIPAQTLAATLKAASSIVETKNTLPILAMVKLAAKAGQLEIVTSNLDIEYQASIPCDGDLVPICVDAKRLAAMASAAKGDISMTLDGSILTVKAGRSRWAAPTLPVDDFPLMPVDALSKPMTAEWGDITKRTLWSASTEMTRAYLSGVYLNNEGGFARYVSTDGYKLASVSTKTKWPKGAPDVTVPAPLAKVISEAGAGQVEWDAAKLRFTSADGVVITGKLLADAGAFPDYRRLMASSPGEPYAVDAGDLLDAVRRVRIGSDAQQRKLRITRKDGALHLRIEGTSGFEGEEEIQADCADGFECGVNADFLVGMLSAMDTDSVAIEHAEPGAVMHFRPIAQRPDMTFEGLIWPLRI